MRRREEHRVTGAQSGRVRRAETKVAITAQLWKQGVGTTPIFLARGQYGDLCVRVLCEQPQEFGAGITRAADNTDLDHGEPVRTLNLWGGDNRTICRKSKRGRSEERRVGKEGVRKGR